MLQIHKNYDGENLYFSSKPHNVRLMGVIETDEFYIKAGLKGRPYRDEILGLYKDIRVYSQHQKKG
jgi:hypothetical protein